MGYRWWVWQDHKPLRFTCAHSNASCQREKWLGWEALFLSFGVFILCTSSCTYSCLPMPVLFPKLFFLPFKTIQPGWSKCTINMPTFYTETILIHVQVDAVDGRMQGSFLSDIFLNREHPGVCQMIPDDKYPVSLTQSWRFLCCMSFHSCFICQKKKKEENVACDRQRERDTLGGIQWVVAGSQEETLKQESVELISFHLDDVFLWENTERSHNYRDDGVAEVKGCVSAVPDGL